LERLQIWDRLGRAGIILTAVAVSDAHGAAGAWVPRPGKPFYWVTHVWAESLAEADLLEALGKGRAFVADPEHFRGAIDLRGRSGTRMGDVLVTKGGDTLEAEVDGLQPGDRVEWVAGGEVAGVSVASEGRVRTRWTAPCRPDGLLPVRIQIVRPSLADAPYRGLIAVSNPIYLSAAPTGAPRRDVVI